MRYRATTRVSVYRGTTTNDYGDEVDTDTTPVYVNVPASLIAQTRTQRNPSSGEVRVTHVVKCRIPRNRAVQKGDRVKDERTGQVYLLEDVTEPPADPGFSRDLSLTLSYTD